MSAPAGGPSRGPVVKALAIAMALSLSAATLSACPEAPIAGYAHLNEDIAEHMKRVGLGPGDVFDVTVYGEEALTRTLQVSPEGDVHFPFINRVHVAGLTPNEVEARFRDKLMDGYIRDPSVTVFVKEYNSKKVFVLGEVNRPGTFPYSARMNIVEAISVAGGFKASANTNYVVVTRKEVGGEQRIPIPVEKIIEGRAANFALQPGDIVFVPDTLL